MQHEAAKHALSQRCSEAEARLAQKTEEYNDALHQARAIQVGACGGRYQYDSGCMWRVNVMVHVVGAASSRCLWQVLPVR